MGNTDRNPLVGHEVTGAPKISHTDSPKSTDKVKTKRIPVKGFAITLSVLSLCAMIIAVSLFWGKFIPVEAADVCIGGQTGCMASVTGGAGRYFVGTDDLVTDEPTDDSAAQPETSTPDESPEDSDEPLADGERFTVTFEFYGRENVSCSMVSPITFGELTDKLGITFTSYDEIGMSPDTVIDCDTVITTDSVTYSTMKVTESIPYETKYVETDELYEGKSRTKQYGENGERVTEYEIKYVNGTEVSRTVVNTYVTVEVKDQIIEKGTKVYTPPPPPVETTPEPDYNTGGNGISNVIGGTDGGTFVGGDGKTYTYLYYIDVTATMYIAGGYAATGVPADENVIAVDPKVIPLGTKVYVTGDFADIGYRSCEDVGGGIKGNHIDVCLNPGNPLVNTFGFRHMRVYILA